MKKIISLKNFLLLATAILFGTLQSCREYDEEIYSENSTMHINKNANASKAAEQDTINNLSENPGDPPIKNGTHWKGKKIYPSPIL